MRHPPRRPLRRRRTLSKPADRVGELAKRSLTGAAYVALTLGAAIIGPWTTFVLFLPVCLIAAAEWYRLTEQAEIHVHNATASMVLAGVAYAAIGLAPMLGGSVVPGLAVILAMLVLYVFDLLRRGSASPGQALAHHLATVMYIALPFALVTWMVERHWHVFVGFMFLLWTSDTGAYLVGRSIGRTKLMPKVSPGKTWEGLAGGVVLTMGVGWLLARQWPELSTAQWLAGAAAVAVTATLGDLLESAFKRARGVKDSGTVLPGHGGILDRFDGYLLAAPAMVVVVALLDALPL